MMIRPHRLLVALVLPLALLAACSGSESVPGDQELQPTSAPSQWESSALDLVTIAAPPGWTKVGATTPEKGTTLTTWHTPPVDGRSSAGMEVREITHPSHDAETAAEGLAVNAMVTMKGDPPDPEKIAWPHATDAWMLTSDITAGPTPAETQTYVSTIFVADLADDTQVQVLVFTEKGPDDDLGTQVLSAIELTEAK